MGSDRDIDRACGIRASCGPPMQVDPPARLLTLSTDPLTLERDRQQLAFVLHGEREDNLENVCDRFNRSTAASRQRTPVSTLERARDRRFRQDPGRLG